MFREPGGFRFGHVPATAKRRSDLPKSAGQGGKPLIRREQENVTQLFGGALQLSCTKMRYRSTDLDLSPSAVADFFAVTPCSGVIGRL